MSSPSLDATPPRDSPEPWAREGDTTVIEETYLGPTQPYESPPRLLENYERKPSPPRTPTKSSQPSKKLPPAEEASPDYHVLTDVTEEAEDDLGTEYDREKIWWQAWKEDGLARLRAKYKVLDREKTIWDCQHFPDWDQWYRNRQLVEAANRGQRYYSNEAHFRDVRSQKLGRQFMGIVEQTEATAKSHPANHVEMARDIRSSDLR